MLEPWLCPKFFQLDQAMCSGGPLNFVSVKEQLNGFVGKFFPAVYCTQGKKLKL